MHFDVGWEAIESIVDDARFDGANKETHDAEYAMCYLAHLACI